MMEMLVTAVIGAAVTLLTTWFKSAKSDAVLKREGAQEADAEANKEADDARSRMSQASAAPRSGALSAGRLSNGSF